MIPTMQTMYDLLGATPRIPVLSNLVHYCQRNTCNGESFYTKHPLWPGVVNGYLRSDSTYWDGKTHDWASMSQADWDAFLAAMLATFLD